MTEGADPLSNSTLRMLMYILGIVIGVILIIVGASADPASAQRGWMIGLGAGIVLASLYAWYRGIGPVGRDQPSDPGPGTGFRFEMQDTIVMAVLVVVCIVGGTLLF
jgi:drug/metabolite transporter (DMT)-like permease